FPTVADLAGVDKPWPEGIEGGSLAPVLRNSGQGVVKRSREEFVVHFPHYDRDPLGPASAILLGRFKLLRFYETGKKHLFDLSDDPGERHDLSAENAEKTEELDQRLTAYLKSVNAQMPTVNSNFDPSKPASTAQRGGRQRGEDRGGRRGRNRDRR
ncbi:MAG: DUF4976 domain-containing protein, partial [bacterium]|nr:DUF4976 domain-containing protein [bacterium]